MSHHFHLTMVEVSISTFAYICLLRIPSYYTKLSESSGSKDQWDRPNVNISMQTYVPPLLSLATHTLSSLLFVKMKCLKQKSMNDLATLDHPLGTLDFHFANLAHRVKCKWVVATCHSFLGWDEAHHSVHCKNSGKLFFSGFHFCEIPLYISNRKVGSGAWTFLGAPLIFMLQCQAL